MYYNRALQMHLESKSLKPSWFWGLELIKISSTSVYHLYHFYSVLIPISHEKNYEKKKKKRYYQNLLLGFWLRFNYLSSSLKAKEIVRV